MVLATTVRRLLEKRSYDEEMMVLKAPFDVDTHKKTFVSYLEVVILEDGKIEYAIPGHQMKLINIAKEKLDVTDDQLSKMCPREYYCDFNVWLSMQTGALCVWNFMVGGVVNENHVKSLKMLRREGLYLGSIPEVGSGGLAF